MVVVVFTANVTAAVVVVSAIGVGDDVRSVVIVAINNDAIRYELSYERRYVRHTKNFDTEQEIFLNQPDFKSAVCKLHKIYHTVYML